VRFASFVHEGAPGAGIVEGDVVRPLAGLSTLVEYIALDPPVRREVPLGDPLPLADVVLTAPVVPRKNVVCVGRNYRDHAAEIARAAGTADLGLADVPVFFTKAPTAIVGPDAAVRFSATVSQQYDWEAELAVVIGTRCRDVPAERAREVVFGYACLNDLTARDLQRAHRQWFKGKSLDDSCPLGPWIADAAEVGDPQRLAISLRLNGVVKQQSNTEQMIFPIDRIIASLSAGMTLEPGDIIATGTPDGVGVARTPPEFLRDGDVVEVEIERIGLLRNTIVIR
jgi:2-keto-4-pentenoate hydratase/2-oxohepta-3-ene-1,7-dioic acid hydratase in catechol pathway